MKPNSSHTSEREFLLLADGELSRYKARRVRAHLAVCPECAERMAVIEARLVDIASTYDEFRPAMLDASGPRALLKARLNEERDRLDAVRGPSPRRIPYGRYLTYASALALLTVALFQFEGWQNRRQMIAGPLPLPDPRYTPGLTRQASLAELCVMDREEVVRTVPPQIQQQVFQEYGIREDAASSFEIDYLITPGLGGSDDLKNLWPEPHADTPWNSYVKDQLEDRLHRMVCEGKIPLEQAQRDIAHNWISAYKEYYRTDQPLARTEPAASAELAFLR